MNTKTIWVLVAVIIIAAGAWYVMRPKASGESPSTNTPVATTTTLMGGSGINVTSTGNGKIQILSDSGAGLTAPSLNHEIIFADNVPTETRLKITQNAAKLVSMLKKDPTNFNAWMDLAIDYKVAGDMKQAEAVWLYLTDAAPSQGISAHNLGTFYHLTVKDFPKAEKYFKLAISREPTQEINYLSFEELYRYSYKQDTTAAVDILKQGLKAIPDSIDLHLALATYYSEDKKDYTDAIAETKLARDNALAKKNTALVEQLNKQIADLQGKQ